MLVISPASLEVGKGPLEVMDERSAGELVETVAVGPLEDVALPCWASAEDVADEDTTVVDMAQLDV